jgi:hypothetical protein
MRTEVIDREARPVIRTVNVDVAKRLTGICPRVRRLMESRGYWKTWKVIGAIEQTRADSNNSLRN